MAFLVETMVGSARLTDQGQVHGATVNPYPAVTFFFDLRKTEDTQFSTCSIRAS